MKKLIVVVLFSLLYQFAFSQDDKDFSDRMRGMLPSNYFALEAAFTPGISGSAGVDGYIDVFKMFGKEKGASWVLNGQYYFYSINIGHDEQFNYNYGYNFGLGGAGYKVGTGVILFEKKSTMRFKFYFDSKSGGDGEKVVSSHYQGPVSKSMGIFLNYYSENSGKGWVPDSLNSYTIGEGHNQYIMPTFRMQKAWNFLKEGINPDGQKGWRYFDVGLPFTKDFSQYGIRLEWFMKTGAFTSRIGFGVMYRTEIPNEPVASRKQKMHFYFPVWFTIGLGGNLIRRTEGDRRFQDKVNVNKSLL